MPIGTYNWDEETYRRKLENLELLNSQSEIRFLNEFQFFHNLMTDPTLLMTDGFQACYYMLR